MFVRVVTGVSRLVATTLPSSDSTCSTFAYPALTCRAFLYRRSRLEE